MFDNPQPSGPRVFKLAMVGYLCPSCHEAHSLWDLTSTARV